MLGAIIDWMLKILGQMSGVTGMVLGVLGYVTQGTSLFMGILRAISMFLSYLPF
jgi:hypothetical protein